MSLKKKIILACSISLAVIIAVVCIIMFAPLPMNVDWDELYDMESNVKLLEAGAEGNPYDDAPALVKYNADGSIDTSDWKVLQFTDMHLSETNKGNLGNDHTMSEFIKSIQEERPDFIAFTGDIITSFRGRARAIQLCEIMERLGIYWAYCLGNHEGDAFYKMPRQELMEIIEKYPHCLSDASVKKTASGESVWGIGNFVVNLLGADSKVVQSMIFMDSGDAISNKDAKEFDVKKGSYDYLKPSQMAWYEEQVMKVTENLTNGVKTMLFIHIPLPEQRNMSYIDPNSDKSKEEGWTFDTPAEGWTYIDGVYAKDHDGNIVGRVAIKDGWSAINGTVNYEGISCSQVNLGMYELMKKLRVGVNGLFCGHDHVNNSVIYEQTEEGETPLYLCYGICSGYATYSLYKNNKTDDPNHLMKGYSVITLHADGSFDYTGVSWDCNHAKTVYIENSLPKA